MWFKRTGKELMRLEQTVKAVRFGYIARAAKKAGNCDTQKGGSRAHG